MAMSSGDYFTLPVVIHNGDSFTIDHTSTTSGVFVVGGTSTTWDAASVRGGAFTGGEWMAHPMTADEIIDRAARELARKRPAD